MSPPPTRQTRPTRKDERKGETRRGTIGRTAVQKRADAARTRAGYTKRSSNEKGAAGAKCEENFSATPATRTTRIKPAEGAPRLPEGVRTFDRLLTARDVRALLTTPIAESSRRKRTLSSLAHEEGVFSALVRESKPRGAGRQEIKLSDAWERACVERGGAVGAAMGKLRRVVEELRSHACTNARAEWHLMRVSPGAEEQKWHADQNAKKCYWTLIVPLTRDPPGSGTEFRAGKGRTVVANPHGGALAFRGNAVHRGTSHPASAPTRLFLYSAFTTGENWN